MKNKLFDLGSTTLSQKILLGIVILVILIVLTSIFTSISNRGEELFDYQTMKAVNFELMGVETTDRELYWTLNTIITNFMSSYQVEQNIDHDQVSYSLKDYYKVLDDSYGRYMNQEKYLQVARNMLNKFIIEDGSSKQLKLENIIKKMYIIDDSSNTRKIYFCELSPAKEGTISYIGIELNSNGKIFNIFYLE